MNLPVEPSQTALEIGAGLVVGLAIGTVYFGMLWRSVQTLVESGSVLRVIALQTLRVGLVGAVLIPVAIYGGALPLVAAATGIVAARELVLRWTGGRP